MSMNRDTYTIDMTPDPSRPHQQRWDVRPEGEQQPDGSWATMNVDIGDPTQGITTPEDFVDELPKPRRAQVAVGGFDDLIKMLSAADGFRARLLRRDLRWIRQIMDAAGLEIILVRPAREDD